MSLPADGVTTDTETTAFSGEDAFLARFTDKEGDDDAAENEQPSSQGDTEDEQAEATAPDDQDDSDESPENEGSEEAEAESKKVTKKYAADDVFFKVKVGDKELDVSSSDLKRLYGQEAALTQRSQALAEQRKAVEAENAKAVTALSIMAQRVKTKADTFRNIDFMALAKKLSDEELAVITAQAREAFDEEKIVGEELTTFMRGISAQQKADLGARAVACNKILSDAADPNYIEGWSEKEYNNIRKFAVDAGIDKEIVNNLVDAPVFRLLKDAMLYRSGKKAVQVVKPTNKTPKKIVKASNSSSQKTASEKKASDALKRLKQTGSNADGVAAFLERFKDADE